MKYRNLEERLLARTVVIPEGEPYAGCWMWMGYPEENGYAKICIRVKPRPANPTTVWVHRFAYEVFHCAEIPTGHDIDHRCHFRLCIHPNHIHPRIAAKNRSEGARRGNAARRAA